MAVHCKGEREAGEREGEREMRAASGDRNEPRHLKCAQDEKKLEAAMLTHTHTQSDSLSHRKSEYTVSHIFCRVCSLVSHLVSTHVFLFFHEQPVFTLAISYRASCAL